jgi:hypothetical protein
MEIINLFLQTNIISCREEVYFLFIQYSEALNFS